MTAKDIKNSTANKEEKKLLGHIRLIKAADGIPQTPRQKKGITQIYTSCHLDRMCTFSNFCAVYKGKIKFPTWRMIWALRNIVNPSLWFFYENERPKPEDMTDITGSLPPDLKESVNFKNIEKITMPHAGRGNKEVSEWCRKNNLNYMTFYMIRSGQRPISTRFAFKARKSLPPKLWFEKAGNRNGE